ncbi:MAG: polya polymerase [Desulfobacterales bacterium]|nr:MAG: polya polymerase [Desulfobacterales bacterium]
MSPDSHTILSETSSHSPLTVITTHINADFDAMACMLAAQKLYPGAVTVFPGAHEKTLRNFFIQSTVYLFNMMDIRQVDMDRVGRLILVDTRQPSRIGAFSRILDREDLEIHIYDHHPAREDDIRGHYEVIRRTGAAVTILIEIIRERGIPLTPDEATIMCVGLYEDTGSFTFNSTTESDLMAGAFLLSLGARLEVVSGITARELNYEQVGMLNDLLRNAATSRFNGVDITISVIDSDHYMQDFSMLVHKIMRMEESSALFAIARMGSRICVVGRSRTPDVDVGAIVRRLKGGGHSFAGSATVRDMTLVQTEQRVRKLLHELVHSSKRARDLMSSPPMAVTADTSLRDARSRMTQYNINALLVLTTPSGPMDEPASVLPSGIPPRFPLPRLLGFISRQVIAKAIYLDLGHVPVREYTSTDPGTVSPEADLQEIQDKIIGHKQRILPVVEEDTVIGVVTRTDLLNILVSQSGFRGAQGAADPDKPEFQARTRRILNLMKDRLPARFLNLLRLAGKTADSLGYGAYAVGGFVRDIFLQRDNEDIDISIEGNGIIFAKRYAAELNARVHPHAKFGTAVIILPDGFKIDVVTARMEYYRFPADLPHVEMSSIKLDMYRRDFTINTLAIQLTQPRFGFLIDYFSALKDIKEKTIRILHNLSFAEDPTRVFRAIRFEQRFGFTIGKLSADLIGNAVKNDFFRRLSGRRILNELKQLLEERNPVPALLRLRDFQLLAVIHPRILLDDPLIDGLETLKTVMDWHSLQFPEENLMKWVPYFMTLTRRLKHAEMKELCGRFSITPKKQYLFLSDRFRADVLLRFLSRDLPSSDKDWHRELSGLSTEALLYLMAAAPADEIRAGVRRFLTRLRYLRPLLRGRDLRKAGIPPGPVYRRILNRLLEARLDGTVSTREEESRMVLDMMGNIMEGGGETDQKTRP